MMESLTPRTDVEAEENGLNRVVSADFARQLERELAEARRELEVWSLRYAGLEVLYLAAMKS